MNFSELIIGTIILRWYVFLFLAGYLFVSISHLGWKRMVIFSLIGFTIGLVSDISSTHNGFPFGLYHYTGLTAEKEFFIGNVPVITALSFIFLSYIGYAVALFLYSPLLISKNDFQVLSTRKQNYSLHVSITGAVIMALIDVVIDPLTLQGGKWFLGNFYWYQDPGYHFGVPFSNYLGWFVVGFTTIFCFQKIDSRFLKKRPALSKGQRYIPFFGIFGVLFYLAILLFMLTVAIFIEANEIFISSIIAFTPFMLLLFVKVGQETKEDTAFHLHRHLEDFPHSPLEILKEQYPLSKT